LFGPDFKHKTTSATIVKVKRGRKTGEPMFDIMFCELKRQIYTNYNLDYILNYTDEVPLKYHKLKSEFILRKANEALASVAAGAAKLDGKEAEDVEFSGKK